MYTFAICKAVNETKQYELCTNAMEALKLSADKSKSGTEYIAIVGNAHINRKTNRIDFPSGYEIIDRLPSIKELRNAAKLSQVNFATYLGTSRRNIENWDSDQSKCSDYIISLIWIKLLNDKMFAKPLFASSANKDSFEFALKKNEEDGGIIFSDLKAGTSDSYLFYNVDDDDIIDAKYDEWLKTSDVELSSEEFCGLSQLLSYRRANAPIDSALDDWDLTPEEVENIMKAFKSL